MHFYTSVHVQYTLLYYMHLCNVYKQIFKLQVVLGKCIHIDNTYKMQSLQYICIGLGYTYMLILYIIYISFTIIIRSIYIQNTKSAYTLYIPKYIHAIYIYLIFNNIVFTHTSTYKEISPTHTHSSANIRNIYYIQKVFM